MKKIVLPLLLLLVFSKLYAQKPITDITLDDLLSSKPKSYFKFQSSYLSNAVYFGRKDSATTLPYITPTLEYNHKSGFYASASASYLANSASTIDFWCLEAGYNFSDTAEKFLATAFINKPFYKETSANLRADVSWNIGANLSYNFGFLNASLSGSLMLGDNSDKFLSLGVDHEFDFEKGNTQFSLIPMATMNFSSSGFYQSFNSKRQNRRTGSPINAKVEITSPNKFQLMSYEISLPFTAEFNSKYGFFAYPTLAIPVNPVVTNFKVTLPSGLVIANATVTEKIGTSFFIEVGGYIKF